MIALKVDCNREQLNGWVFDDYVKLMRLYTSEMDKNGVYMFDPKMSLWTLLPILPYLGIAIIHVGF